MAKGWTIAAGNGKAHCREKAGAGGSAAFGGGHAPPRSGAGGFPSVRAGRAYIASRH